MKRAKGSHYSSSHSRDYTSCSLTVKQPASSHAHTETHMQGERLVRFWLPSLQTGLDTDVQLYQGFVRKRVHDQFYGAFVSDFVAHQPLKLKH